MMPPPSPDLPHFLLRMLFYAAWEMARPLMPGLAAVVGFALAFRLCISLFKSLFGGSSRDASGPGAGLLLAVLLPVLSGSPVAAQSTSGDPTMEWIPPLTPLSPDLPMGQFWAIVNWFTPILMPLLLLSFGSLAFAKVYQHFFKGGGG